MGDACGVGFRDGGTTVAAAMDPSIYALKTGFARRHYKCLSIF